MSSFLDREVPREPGVTELFKEIDGTEVRGRVLMPISGVYLFIEIRIQRQTCDEMFKNHAMTACFRA